MDKTALLVVLGLQILLLVSAFTSADAADLMTDVQQEETPQLSKIGASRKKTKFWIRSGCFRRPGACSSLRYPTKPPTDVQSLLNLLRKERT